ncbi:MAG TPA: GDYXXLXY domain-containing protein [Saprospiraceae bacterium]|nr:GDYXXLXY domain-containing protein [Saprospiraceae bacterium]
MRYLIIILFLMMVAIQWFVPLSVIVGHEKVLADGKVFKFKTQPVDPSDPFRGKYITLRFEETSFPVDTSLNISNGDDIFVLIEEDGDGFAKITDIKTEKPEHTENFINAKAGYVVDNNNVEVEYPFERFYLEESKASEAERAYWEANRDSTQTTYALVAVRNGTAALKDVMIDDKSVTEVVEKLNSK